MSITQRILICLFLLLVASCSSIPPKQNTIPASSQSKQLTGTITPVSSQQPPAQIILSPIPYPDPNQSIYPAPTFNPYPFPFQKPTEAVITPSPTPSPTPTSLPERIEILFEDLGLVWRECEIPRPQNQSQEDCLGVARSENYKDDESPFGEFFLPPGAISRGWRLSIGDDVYEALHQPYMTETNSGMKPGFTDPDGWGEFKLFKNGQVLLTRKTRMAGYENAGLLNINGKYAWEFANPFEETVIYDGVDLRQELGLEGAYRPYVINGKMIFVARNNGKMFVVVDGKQIGPEFDKIENGYCCETIPIIRRPGQYWFWGNREGRSFVVVITAIE